MTALRTLFLTTALAATATSSAAQIVPVEQAGPYRIMRVESRKVCFAAVELMSEANKPMIYSYYATSLGQRWNVAGYASETEIENDVIGIAVAIDDTETVSRETETQGGDFLLPFEALAEIEAHEALLKTGDVMSISIGGDDTLLVPLDDHRLALEAMSQCLATL